MDADISFGAFYLDEFRISGILDQKVGHIFVHLAFLMFGISQLGGSQLLFYPHLIDRNACFFAYFPECRFMDIFAALDFSLRSHSFYFAAEGVSFDEQISRFSV